MHALLALHGSGALEMTATGLTPEAVADGMNRMMAALNQMSDSVNAVNARMDNVANTVDAFNVVTDGSIKGLEKMLKEIISKFKIIASTLTKRKHSSLHKRNQYIEEVTLRFTI